MPKSLDLQTVSEVLSRLHAIAQIIDVGVKFFTMASDAIHTHAPSARKITLSLYPSDPWHGLDRSLLVIL